jgi:hypothetical protein
LDGNRRESDIADTISLWLFINYLFICFSPPSFFFHLDLATELLHHFHELSIPVICLDETVNPPSFNHVNDISPRYSEILDIRKEPTLILTTNLWLQKSRREAAKHTKNENLVRKD